MVRGRRHGRGRRGGRQGKRRDGEGLLFALVGAVGVEDDGAALLVLIVHEAAVLEVCNQGRLALDTRVGDLALLLRVELLPFLVVELLIERNQRLAVHEVNKSIAHVALVLEVDGEIEEVVGALVPLVNGSKEHLLAVLVRDVLNHQRGTLVGPVADAVDVENVLGLVLLLGLLGVVIIILRELGLRAGGVGVLPRCM